MEQTAHTNVEQTVSTLRVIDHVTGDCIITNQVCYLKSHVFFF